MLVWAIPTQADVTETQEKEFLAMVHSINHPTLAYKAEEMKRMLVEANVFSERLKLPTARPININDVLYPHVSPPWFGIIQDSELPYFPATCFSNSIYNSEIPREQRLQALQFGVRGTIETTNFFFSFLQGKLCDVERLGSHNAEYYSDRLDQLVGKPSLIDTNDAFQLATQWLAAVDADMPALRKLTWTVNQLHYKAKGASNAVTLPLYYVDFGSKHYRFAPGSPMKDFDQPQVTVEILGTTKQLQEMRFIDLSLAGRPTLILTNGLELVRITNAPQHTLAAPLH
jgi:hypothetical protein